MTAWPDWAARYRELAAAVADAAPEAGPHLMRVQRLRGRDLAGRRRAPRPSHPTGRPGRRPASDATGARLLGQALARILAGHGGELALDWPGGPDWFAGRLPAPDRLQVGGTGPQAAWTLAELGARTVVPLADRSARQLSVLHPAIEIAEPAGLTPVRAADRPIRTAPARPMHHILEFTAGTAHPGGALPRSTRIILRFAADGIERDERLVAAPAWAAARLRGAVLSGMNGIADGDRASWAWLDRMVDAWVDGRGRARAPRAGRLRRRGGAAPRPPPATAAGRTPWG